MSQLGDNPNQSKDALPADQTGTTSKTGKGTSKEGKPVTLSQKDYTKLKSDAEASAGRAKELTTTKTDRDNLKGQVETLNTRLEALETATRNAALAEAQKSGDSGALTLFNKTDSLNQRERAIIDRESKVKQRELQVQADEEESGRTKATLTIPKIVAKYKLDEAGQTHLEELGITDEEALDKIAARMAATGALPETETEETEEGTPKVQTFEPISTESTGARKPELTSETAASMPTKDLEHELAPPPK